MEDSRTPYGRQWGRTHLGVVLDELDQRGEGPPPGDEEAALVELPYPVVFDAVSLSDCNIRPPSRLLHFSPDRDSSFALVSDILTRNAEWSFVGAKRAFSASNRLILPKNQLNFQLYSQIEVVLRVCLVAVFLGHIISRNVASLPG